MDIKAWLESAGFAGKVEETAFESPPALPYLLYLDREKHRGADYEFGLCGHDLAVELYSKRIDRDSQRRLERLFLDSGCEYERTHSYLPTERIWQTVYYLEFLEKEGILTNANA